jgi:hypothetical protein
MQLAKTVYARRALLQWRHKFRSNRVIKTSHAQVTELRSIHPVLDHMHHYEEAQSTSETVFMLWVLLCCSGSTDHEKSYVYTSSVTN